MMTFHLPPPSPQPHSPTLAEGNLQSYGLCTGTERCFIKITVLLTPYPLQIFAPWGFCKKASQRHCDITTYSLWHFQFSLTNSIIPTSILNNTYGLLTNTGNYSVYQTLSSVAQSCPTLCNPMQTAACQASLSITNSRSLLKVISIELVMP